MRPPTGIDGQADAVIGDEQIVRYHIYSNRLTDRIKKTGEPLYTGKNCMASRLDNALLVGILNKGIEKARKTGVLDKIGKKWLGTTYGRQESALERYALPAVIATGVMLVLSLAIWLWNMQLRAQVRAKTATIVLGEQALREREMNLRTFFNSMSDLVLVGTYDGRILQCNAATVQKLGFSLDELRTMYFLDVHPLELRAEAAGIITAMAAGETDDFVRYRCSTRTACWFPLKPVSGTANGMARTVCSACAEISARNRSTAEVQSTVS